MNAKDRLAALIEAIYTAYRNALTEPHRPAKTPAKIEEIQEGDRYRAERYLDAMRHRMPL
jgi:hypothetical protein